MAAPATARWRGLPASGPEPATPRWRAPAPPRHRTPRARNRRGCFSRRTGLVVGERGVRTPTCRIGKKTATSDQPTTYGRHATTGRGAGIAGGGVKYVSNEIARWSAAPTRCLCVAHQGNVHPVRPSRLTSAGSTPSRPGARAACRAYPDSGARAGASTTRRACVISDVSDTRRLWAWRTSTDPVAGAAASAEFAKRPASMASRPSTTTSLGRASTAIAQSRSAPSPASHTHMPRPPRPPTATHAVNFQSWPRTGVGRAGQRYL